MLLCVTSYIAVSVHFMIVRRWLECAVLYICGLVVAVATVVARLFYLDTARN